MYSGQVFNMFAEIFQNSTDDMEMFRKVAKIVNISSV